MGKRKKLDPLDVKILEELQRDCRMPLQDIADRIRHPNDPSSTVPTSTVHYRVKRLEKDGIIDGYYAKINPELIGLDYITIIQILVTCKEYSDESIGEDLSKIPGVGAVYYSLGEQDFFVLTRSRNREEFLQILNKIMAVKGVLRTFTQVIAKVIKEDPRLNLSSLVRTKEED